MRAKVQGKSRGIDRGDACAGLSNRKSEFILNVSLCECVCVSSVGFSSGCFELQRIFVWVFGYGIRMRCVWVCCVRLDTTFSRWYRRIGKN